MQHGDSCQKNKNMNENKNRSIELTTSGCLFDLDGTLMLSTKCVEAFWRDFGKKHNIDADELLSTSHGRRTYDILQMWKPEMATKEISSDLEATIPERWNHIAKPVPGVHKLLRELPRSRWGIVTSGTHVMATRWLDNFLGIRQPDVFITAEQIKEGKPHPEGYIKGHKQLNLLDHFIVFEDAPAGIRAGKAAGAVVVGMATTYGPETVKKAGADYVVKDLTQISLERWNPQSNELTLRIDNPIEV